MIIDCESDVKYTLIAKVNNTWQSIWWLMTKESAPEVCEPVSSGYKSSVSISKCLNSICNWERIFNFCLYSSFAARVEDNTGILSTHDCL